jgi:hypothetical protein
MDSYTSTCPYDAIISVGAFEHFAKPAALLIFPARCSR